MFTVAGYQLDPDRAYDPTANLWVSSSRAGCVRVGYDPLGAETTGDIVAISFAAVGTRVCRGDALATVEAAKFVGPLPSPVGAVVAQCNEAVLGVPGLINVDPLDTWLVELEDVDPLDSAKLLRGEEAIAAWFAEAVEQFRSQGAIAE